MIARLCASPLRRTPFLARPTRGNPPMCIALDCIVHTWLCQVVCSLTTESFLCCYALMVRSFAGAPGLPVERTEQARRKPCGAFSPLSAAKPAKRRILQSRLRSPGQSAEAVLVSAPMHHELESPSTYQEHDPSGMAGRLRGFADQCRQAATQYQSLTLPPDYRSAESVVICGMGGSAIGGELLRSLLAHQRVPTPITIWRDWGLPEWAGPRTLVIVCSYSGNTTETLSAFRAASEKNARIVVVTSGGVLGHEAKRLGVPTLPVSYRGEPRTAVGYLFSAAASVMRAAGLGPDLTQGILEAADFLRQAAPRYCPEQPEPINPAKSLARRLYGRLPVIYGGGYLAPVAVSWKSGFNENSKTWAVADFLPELNHNSVAGFLNPPEIRERVSVILLRSALLPMELQQRTLLTEELLVRCGVSHVSVEAEGDTAVSHMLGLVWLGTWASYYLGLLCGVDPSPVGAVKFTKEGKG